MNREKNISNASEIKPSKKTHKRAIPTISTWSVYILKCADETLYTGVTTDLSRRVKEHNTSALGAKYTRHRRPVELAYFESCDDKVHAMQREYAIKQLSRSEKLKLISQAQRD